MFRLIVSGNTHSEISGQLHISKDTAREYIAHVYTKFDVHRRSELVAKAIAAGLLSLVFMGGEPTLERLGRTTLRTEVGRLAGQALNPPQDLRAGALDGDKAVKPQRQKESQEYSVGRNPDADFHVAGEH